MCNPLRNYTATEVSAQWLQSKPAGVCALISHFGAFQAAPVMFNQTSACWGQQPSHLCYRSGRSPGLFIRKHLEETHRGKGEQEPIVQDGRLLRWRTLAQVTPPGTPGRYKVHLEAATFLFFTLPGGYIMVLQPWGRGCTWVPCGEKSSDDDLLQAQLSSCLLPAVPKHPCTIPSHVIMIMTIIIECHLQDLNKTKRNGWKLPRCQDHGAVDVLSQCQRDRTDIYSELFQCFSWPWRAGTAATCMMLPNNLKLILFFFFFFFESPNIAKTYFQHRTPVLLSLTWFFSYPQSLLLFIAIPHDSLFLPLSFPPSYLSTTGNVALPEFTFIHRNRSTRTFAWKQNDNCEDPHGRWTWNKIEERQIGGQKARIPWGHLISSMAFSMQMILFWQNESWRGICDWSVRLLRSKCLKTRAPPGWKNCVTFPADDGSILLTALGGA